MLIPWKWFSLSLKFTLFFALSIWSELLPLRRNITLIFLWRGLDFWWQQKELIFTIVWNQIMWGRMVFHILIRCFCRIIRHRLLLFIYSFFHPRPVLWCVSFWCTFFLLVSMIFCKFSQLVPRLFRIVILFIFG